MVGSLIHRTLLQKEVSDKVPFWFMRQAGRYLPEYREIRTEAGGFLDLCFNPKLAAEVTLQPVKRFDVSAAIIFADILLIPQAMGAELRFEQGEGPRLSVTRDYRTAERLTTSIESHLRPVAEAIKRVRGELEDSKSLIGFCGAPWTVACYMVQGQGDPTYELVRRFALKEEKTFSLVIDKIITASVVYLSMQVNAGADIIQIFDSWAGILSESEYEKWVIEPTKRLVSRFKTLHPDIPVIGFPRGSGAKYAAYAEATGVDGVSLDSHMPVEWAKDHVKAVLQGNLDSLVLASGQEAAVSETQRILKIMAGKPFIFNLGHGILQDTPIENVGAVCDAIKNGT